jgi:predicted NBD/HSP70 family sugar kinase
MPAVTFTTGGALGKSAMREANERLILTAIRQNPSLSRADIVRITGLSPSSVTFIVNRMKRDKLICEEKKSSGQGLVGRQPTALNLRPDARIAIGVEIGLSGARIILGDLNDKVIGKKTVPWHPNYNVFFDRVHGAIRGLIEPSPPGQVLGVGVALPGFIDRNTGKVIAAENFNWFGVEAGSLLQQTLKVPFFYENTAKLSALSELWSSGQDPKPLRDLVFVTARGGLGTGVIVNGQILQGAFSAACEFGHVIIDPAGRRCACGNIGCWEQYASDLALCRDYAERGGAPGADGPLDAEGIVTKARQGDPIAREVLHEVARQAAIGFANLIMALNPEAIIVGDYLAEGWDLMEETVWGILRSRIPSYYLGGLRIFPSRHRADSSLVGAMSLVLSHFFSRFEHGNQAKPSRSVFIRASG